MSQAHFSTVYQPGKLLLGIVRRGQGEVLMAAAKKAGARGGTIMLGQTSSDNKVLRFLGLDERDSDIVFILLQDNVVEPVWLALRQGQRPEKMFAGIALCLDINGILRHVCHGDPDTPRSLVKDQDRTMSLSASHELIGVIVNTGFAGEVMEAARKAGAPGGTIINARGTGKEEDVKFFGITIVPEKEFLIIVVPKQDAAKVLEAVRGTVCLEQPGIGVAFCLDVEQFITLGKAQEQKKL